MATTIKKVTCYYCNEKVKESETFLYEDNIVCNTCKSDYFYTCDNCSEPVHFDDMYSTDNSTYCQSCYRDNTFACYLCDERFDGSSDYSYNGESVCSSCSDSVYCCFNCGQDHTDESNYYCNECEEDYCQDCYSNGNHDEHEGNNDTSSIRRTTAIDIPFYKGSENGKVITIDRLVGVEIEAEEGSRTNALCESIRSAHATYSSDGSLDSSGIEVQTFPASLNKLEEVVESVTKTLKDSGYKATKQCGLHVHIDARDFKDNHTAIVNLIKTFYATEDLLYSMLPPSRWINHYSKRLSKDYLYTNFNKKITKEKLEQEVYRDGNTRSIEARKQNKYDSARYYGLNIHSIFYRGTLELRYHSGTLEAYKILNWTDLLLHMVEYALTRYDEKFIQTMFNTQTSREKFEAFCKAMGLRSNTISYMLGRTDKFNRNYRVKFNKGKKVRTTEKQHASKQQAKQKKELEANKQRAEEMANELAKAYIKVRYGLGLTLEQEEEIRQLIVNELLTFSFSESVIDDIRHGTLHSIGFVRGSTTPPRKECGFLNDEEVTGYIDLIHQGMNMQRVNSDSMTVDYEG